MDFFLIGAQKCATSWLYLCLRDHPGILIHSKKDESNYIGGPRYLERGHEWFLSLYPDRSPPYCRGAASVDYLFDTRALGYVLDRYPSARYIVCLRNPYDRMISAHQFLSRKGLIGTASLDDSLGEALRLYRAGIVSPVTELLTRSLYAQQLRPFADRQILDRLMPVSYEELCRCSVDILSRIFAFIGVDATFVPQSFDLRPKRNANWPSLTRIERLAPRSYLLAKSMDLTNQWLCRLGLGRAPSKCDSSLLESLREVLAPDVVALDGMLDQVPPTQRLFPETATRTWGLAG